MPVLFTRNIQLPLISQWRSSIFWSLTSFLGDIAYENLDFTRGTLNSSANAFSRSSRRATATTLAPFPTKSSTMPLPTPEDAPVITTDLFVVSR